MYGVELYGLVRRAVMRDGLSHREAARRFGIDRGTVAKMLVHSEPPGYRHDASVGRPKLEAHVAFIDQILDDDERALAKQRHTAWRIFERLRDERGFDGGYSTVRDYVRSRRRVRKEVFVPLAHPLGHVQADFGEATAILGGVEQKVRFFVMDLPQSDAIFVKAYHSETAEAFCDGHVEAFAFFGGVPQSILYDNTRLAKEPSAAVRASPVGEQGSGLIPETQRSVKLLKLISVIFRNFPYTSLVLRIRSHT